MHRLSRFQKLNSLLILSVVLALTYSCALPTSTKIEMSGESLNSMGLTFDRVSQHMTRQCIANVYTKKTCADFVLASDKFKLAFPPARSMWNTAVKYEDEGLASAAQSAFNKLAADMAPFVKLMGGAK